MIGGEATTGLVGRAEELERIATARAAGGPGVVLIGGAGVGKSRVGREAAAAAERGGAFVEWVLATRSAASVPLGAFADLVPPSARTDDLRALLRGSVAALQDRAGRRSAVVAVDDAQLLDEPSAALVLHIAETGAAFVLATVRSGDAAPDAIVSLWKDAGLDPMELDPFTREETATFVEATLGATAEQRALGWLHETSGGNALYLRELLRGAVDDGALARVRGVWRLERTPPVGRSLVDLVGTRMAELGEPERRAVELLAIGEPLRLPDLTALVGEEPLMALEARGIATVGTGPGGAVRLAHPLYGEAIRASLGALRGRSARLALARLVQARAPVSGDDALRIARWLLDAGEPIPPGLVLEAARAATLASDAGLAAQLSGLAVEQGGGLQAKMLLARAHASRHRFEAAEAVLASAEGEVGDEATGMAYLEQRRSLLFWDLRRRDDLTALLERAGRWFPTQSWRLALAPLRIYATTPPGRVFGRAHSDAPQLLDPDLDPELRRQMEPMQVSQLLYSGRAHEAWELASRIRPRSMPLRDPSEELAQILWSTTSIASGVGDWVELEAELSRIFRSALQVGDTVAAGLTAIGIGALRLLASCPNEATRWLDEAELQLERRDTMGVLAIVRAYQVAAAATRGDPEGAEEALRRMREGFAGADPLPNQIPYVAWAEALAATADGDRARACDILLTAAGDMGESPLFAATLTYEALRAGADPRRQAAALGVLRASADAPLVALWASHAEASAARDGIRLLEAADGFEAIGAIQWASEAAAEAAVVFGREAREDSSRRAAARSRELSARGDGAPLAALAALGGPAVALTARESQIIELAGRGLTNAEIADRLVLSSRTVESHLYRAMRKLGVSDRRDL